MVDTPMPPIELAERFALVVALAVFLGLAFEEVYKRDEPEIPGGIRTFPLVALAGTLLYLLEPHRALAFVAGLLALGHGSMPSSGLSNRKSAPARHWLSRRRTFSPTHSGRSR
jgi:hypothetical protein